MSKATLPRVFLSPPAELALKSLQALCLLSDRFKHRTFLDSLDPDGKALLDICWNLETKGYRQEDITRLNTNSILDEHIRWVSKGITDDGLAKLAILTWSVDANSQLLSQELFYFLINLREKADILCPKLHTTYSNIAGSYSTDWSFRQDLTELLDSLKYRLTHEWNVVWKYMSLERQILEDNDEEEWELSSNVSEIQNYAVPGAEPAQAHVSVQEQQIFLQPEARLTTKELVNEVREIYSGLVIVEKKCIEMDKQHTGSPNKLSDHEWQSLISLHQTLLHKHRKFFLASQHLSVSPVLKQTSEEYAMPARMWCHGIHSFLELLRHRLPDTLEHMLAFLHSAYSMMTLFQESIPAFEGTWIECLGDLARYRMAVEKSDPRNRETWAGIARCWYLQLADKKPNVGRIQHHLAVLTRPDMLQQLFYYTKSLVSVHPFPSAGESIQFLFHPLLNGPKPDNQPVVASAFVTAHGKLFMQRPLSDFKTLMSEYLFHLDGYISGRGSAFKMCGVFIASCNFAAIFQYWSTDAVLPNEFKESLAQDETGLTASKNWMPVDNLDAIEAEFCEYQNSQSQSKLVYYGAHLAFKTFSVLLNRIDNENVFPAVHAYLAFIWSMARNNTSIRHIELVVPWRKLTMLLNKMIHSNTDSRVMERNELPVAEDRKSLPEDLLLHGQIWSQRYFSADYFEGALAEDNGRSIEVLSLTVARMYRCLWLGVQLAKVCFCPLYSRQILILAVVQPLDRVYFDLPKIFCETICPRARETRSTL